MIRSADLAFKSKLPPLETCLSSGEIDSLQVWIKRASKSGLYVEIGCGVGFHPIDWAKKNPRLFVLAIEKTSEKFKKFLGRMKSHPHLKNIYPLQADATRVLPHLISPESVDGYFFLYPNPYPKESQKNLRFQNSLFFEFVIQSLKLGGTITWATNCPKNLGEIKTRMVENYCLKLIETRELACPQETYLSHFEKKYLEQGQVCHHLVFQR